MVLIGRITVLAGMSVYLPVRPSVHPSGS